MLFIIYVFLEKTCRFSFYLNHIKIHTQVLVLEKSKYMYIFWCRDDVRFTPKFIVIPSNANGIEKSSIKKQTLECLLHVNIVLCNQENVSSTFCIFSKFYVVSLYYKLILFEVCDDLIFSSGKRNANRLT